MKLLMFLSPRFRFRPFVSTLTNAPAAGDEQVIENCAVIFVHAEEGDEEYRSKLISKFVKNVKWIANKRSYRNVVLHSFTHLSESKAGAASAETFLTDAASKLSDAGYCVNLTPFGYSCEWELAVHGEPLAKVYKSL